MTRKDIEIIAQKFFAETKSAFYLNVYGLVGCLFFDANIRIPEETQKEVREKASFCYDIKFNEKPKELFVEYGMMYIKNGKFHCNWITTKEIKTENEEGNRDTN